jgi:hypothetical protein
MANKNHSGTQLMRAKNKEERLIEDIDKRAANGSNKENVNDTYNTYRVNDGGERVWSF